LLSIISATSATTFCSKYWSLAAVSADGCGLTGPPSDPSTTLSAFSRARARSLLKSSGSRRAGAHHGRFCNHSRAHDVYEARWSARKRTLHRHARRNGQWLATSAHVTSIALRQDCSEPSQGRSWFAAAICTSHIGRLIEVPNGRADPHHI
jgi:hypothetical protein